MKWTGLLLLVLCLIPSVAFDTGARLWASTEVVEFSQQSLRQRYYQLIQELRCPKCQNQNLADSNAPISTDMKAQIQRMLEEQKSDQQIKEYLVSRYSEFILYRPEVNKNTWFLWFAPICFVLLGGLVIWRHSFSGRRSNSSQAQESLQLNAEQQRRLSELLDYGEDKL